MPEQEELYARLAKALHDAEMPHRTPEELADPMAVAEFVNAILKRCREVINHEIFRD